MVEEERWGEEVAGEPSEEDLKVMMTPALSTHTHTAP